MKHPAVCTCARGQKCEEIQHEYAPPQNATIFIFTRRGLRIESVASFFAIPRGGRVMHGRARGGRSQPRESGVHDKDGNHMRRIVWVKLFESFSNEKALTDKIPNRLP